MYAPVKTRSPLAARSAAIALIFSGSHCLCQLIASANSIVPKYRKRAQLKIISPAEELPSFGLVQCSRIHRVVRSCSRLTFVNLYVLRIGSSDHGQGFPLSFLRRSDSLFSMNEKKAVASDIASVSNICAVPRVLASRGGCRQRRAPRGSCAGRARRRIGRRGGATKSALSCART